MIPPFITNFLNYLKEHFEMKLADINTKINSDNNNSKSFSAVSHGSGSAIAAETVHLTMHNTKIQFELTNAILYEIASQLDKNAPVEISVAGKDYAAENGMVRTGVNIINSFLLNAGFSVSEINIFGIVGGMHKTVEVKDNRVLINFDN